LPPEVSTPEGGPIGPGPLEGGPIERGQPEGGPIERGPFEGGPLEDGVVIRDGDRPWQERRPA
jgi:hypothetical protein